MATKDTAFGESVISINRKIPIPHRMNGMKDIDLLLNERE